VNWRLGTSAPPLVVSTRSHEPRVNLNSMAPRTLAGSSIVCVPSPCRSSRYADMPGFQPLNVPAM
jgi:hypothetical protein